MPERVCDVVVVVQLVGYGRMAVALMPVRLRRHRRDLAQVLVRDLFLRVGQLEEPLPRRIIRALAERDPEPAQAVVERVAARPRGQHDARGGETPGPGLRSLL